MKIRNGFVSNSSSSSFMLVGLTVNETGMTIKELQNLGFRFANEAEIVGVHWNVSEYKIDEIPVTEVLDAIQKVRDKLGKEPRVYVGMEMC